MPLENKENAEYEYEVIEEDWERLSPCLALKNDQTGGKYKDLRTKRKFNLDGLEHPAAEGPSDLKCKVTAASCDAAEPVKLLGKGEAASQPLGCLCPKLTCLEASDEATGTHACPTLPKVIERYPKKQKASHPSASQSSLELFKVNMSRILKLKTQMHEKQMAVLSVRRQTRKGSSKKIVRMEKELQDLQSQLYSEQAQQQARVEQLEKTFQEEEHHLQVPQRCSRQRSPQLGRRVVNFWLELSLKQGPDAKLWRQSGSRKPRQSFAKVYSFSTQMRSGAS